MPKSGRIEQSKYKPVMEKAGNYDIKWGSMGIKGINWDYQSKFDCKCF